MKLLFVGMLLTGLVSFLSPSAFSDSLLESAWSRYHPGFLPFSSCHFESFSMGKVGLLIAGSRGKAVLVCDSRLGGTFEIPLRITGISLGLTAYVAGQKENTEGWPFVEGLEGYEVEDLLKGYLGVSFNIAAVAAAGVHGGMSRDGIYLFGGIFGVGAGLDFSLERLKLSLPRHLTLSMCENEKMLLDRTHGVRSEADCRELLGDEGMRRGKVKFDFRDLKRMRFLKQYSKVGSS